MYGVIVRDASSPQPRTPSNVTYWCFPCDYNCECEANLLFVGVVRSDLSTWSYSNWSPKRYGYCADSVLAITDIFAEADESLFRRILNNESHVLRQLLPETRKLCYRKDDRTMRPIHGCPENFRDTLTMPTAIISNIFHGLLFGSTLWMFIHNLKSVALSVLEIIGGNQKIWAVPGYAHAPFSPKFLMGFYSDWPCKCTHQIWSV